MSSGIVLFAHGSRERDWALPFNQLADILRTKSDGPVVVAYLESMAPTLEEAIGRLAGVNSIRVVPVFRGQGGHVKEDLPKLIASAQKKHPRLTIQLEPAIGEPDRARWRFDEAKAALAGALPALVEEVSRAHA